MIAVGGVLSNRKSQIFKIGEERNLETKKDVSVLCMWPVEMQRFASTYNQLDPLRAHNMI